MIDESIDVLLGTDKKSGAYLLATISPVHRHRCPSTSLGKSSGPCNCGARELFDRFVATSRGDPWGAVRSFAALNNAKEGVR